MNRDMKKWLVDITGEHKKPMPILSYPALGFMDITVKELVTNAQNLADAMCIIAKKTDSGVAVSIMDLSVEAECFGAKVNFFENEVPAVVGRLINDMDEAEALAIPEVGSGRSGICIEAIRLASEKIDDRPVLAGVIGPFSLAGRLLDVTEIMYDCFDEPEKVHLVMEKCTAFLIDYCRAMKAAGADGVIIAEPLTGLLSPDMAEEFSEGYVRKLVGELKADDFAVIYHNCGGGVKSMLASILRINASAYHFGNAVDMAEILEMMPADTVAMGNIDPVSMFCNAKPENMKEEVTRILEKCSIYPGFVLSSGCDIPHTASWENINAFFAAADSYFNK